MSVRGWVTGCALVNQGSELTADAAVGATALSVDWVGDFDDTGGTLLLNGIELNYAGVDEAADAVMLSTPLAAAAAVGDRVDAVVGGQVLKDYTLFVTIGDGDDAEVDIPFGDRDAWPEGEYDDPVEVVLSDDLERVESVPGRGPVRTLAGGEGAEFGPFANGFQMTGALFVPVVAANEYVEVPIVYTDEIQGSTGTYVTTYELRATNAVLAPRFFTTSPSFADAGTSPNTYISTGGEIAKVPPSAAKYKHNIVDVDLDADAVVALRPVQFEYLPEVGAGDGLVVGFIADEAEVLGLTNWVEHGPDGQVENFAYMRWTAAQQIALRDHHARVAELEQTVADLIARIEQLEAT